MKFLVILLAFYMLQLPSISANQSGFLWQLAESHRQDGNLVLEEVALKKLFSIDPGYPNLQKRLKELDAMRKAGDLRALDDRLQGIQTILRGDTQQIVGDKNGAGGFQSPDEEAKFFEKSLLNKSLSQNQKAQMKERLATYYFSKGMAAIKGERIREAIESLEKSIHYNKNFQLSYYELGFLYFRIRELQLGIKNLEQFVELQPSGILSKTVRENLLNKYMTVARTYYFKQDFNNCKPYLEKIIKLNRTSPEADTALVFLMNLYYFIGLKHLKLEDYEQASHNFYNALSALREKPSLDNKLFGKLSKDAVDPFIKYAQKLFVINKSYGEAYPYFEAVSWLVPGTTRAFLAKEYMREIQRLNETAENPIVYFSNFIEEENQRFLLEQRGLEIGKSK